MPFTKKIYHLISLLTYLITFEALVCAQNYNYEQISLKEGLKQSQVNKVFSDSRGFLWLATAGGGLSIYDGINFINFTENEGLVGNIVTDIAEDKNGNIYCSSAWGGISKIAGLNITTIVSTEELSTVFAIEQDNYGTVWVVSNRLAYLENDKLIYIETDLQAPFSNKIELSAKGDILYVTYNNKLLQIDVTKKKQVFSKTFNFQINCSLEDGLGNIWLGTTKNSIYKCNKSGEILMKHTISIIENGEDIQPSIRDLKQETNTTIWAATEYGLVRIQNDTTLHIQKKDGLLARDIQSICFDNQSNIWLGAFGDGVIKITKTPFTYYNSFSQLKKSDNFPIYEDPDGNVWVGNNNEGLYKYNGKSVEVFNDQNGFISAKIRAFEYFKETLYIGTNKGLYSLSKNGVFKHLLKNVYVKSLAKNSQNQLYIGTTGDGLWLLDEEKNISQVNFNKEKSVHSLLFDKKDVLYVGSNDGLFVYKDSVFTNFKKGLNNSYIGSMTIDKNGLLWVGTDKSIALFDGKSFTCFTEKQGLNSSLVYLIYCDMNGYLWVGTNNGLDKITLNNKSELIKIKHYGYYEGFTGIECNSQGVFENTKGELYFNTVGGLIKYSPKLDSKPIINLPVYITDVKLFLKN